MQSAFFSVRRALCALPLCFGLSLACGGDDKSSNDDQSGGATDAGSLDSGSLDSGAVDASVRDASSGPTGDAGTVPVGDAGSGAFTLAGLAGRYIARWDTIGTATSSFAGIDVKIRSRLSTLVVAELTLSEGKLTSKERVCTQVGTQTCLNYCDAASTVIDPRVISNFLPTRFQTRDFTLADDGTFTAGVSVAQLGYDDPNPDADHPTTDADTRVWDVVPGDPREGFLSKITVTALGVAVPCETYGVQKFVTSFSGKLGGSASAPQIPQMDLDLGDSDAVVLGADPTVCGQQQVDVPVDVKNARMVRYGDSLTEDAFWACPDPSVFDAMLPATADAQL